MIIWKLIFFYYHFHRPGRISPFLVHHVVYRFVIWTFKIDIFVLDNDSNS